VLTKPTDGAGVRGTCVRLGMRFYEVSIEHGWWDVLIQPLPFDSWHIRKETGTTDVRFIIMHWV